MESKNRIRVQVKIHLTEFARQRHFDAAMPGTTIGDRSASQFSDELGDAELHQLLPHDYLEPGYADFCKLVFLQNWTDARVGTMRITSENETFLKSGYKARNEREVPVLTRWFEGLKPPRAKYLCVVLYSREQLQGEKTDIPEDCDYGVVAILGQSSRTEEPMPPITVMRNALGIAEGGSGVLFDRDDYRRSVEFWKDHATVLYKWSQ